MVWYARKIKFIIAESDRKLNQLENNADILTRQTFSMHQVLTRRETFRKRVRESFLLKPETEILKQID